MIKKMVIILFLLCTFPSGIFAAEISDEGGGPGRLDINGYYLKGHDGSDESGRS